MSELVTESLMRKVCRRIHWNPMHNRRSTFGLCFGIAMALTSHEVAAQFMPSLNGILQEIKCGVIATDKTGNPFHQTIPLFHVRGISDAPHRFVLPASSPKEVKAVFCVRSAIELGANDYEVLAAGYPFVIYSDDNRRVATLGLELGKLQLQMIRGEMNSEESSRMQKGLEQQQARLDASEKMEPNSGR